MNSNDYAQIVLEEIAKLAQKSDSADVISTLMMAGHNIVSAVCDAERADVRTQGGPGEWAVEYGPTFIKLTDGRTRTVGEDGVTSLRIKDSPLATRSEVIYTVGNDPREYSLFGLIEAIR